ncbi:MAG: DUF4384 domain-containing protein [Pseudomonadota bacterium]
MRWLHVSAAMICGLCWTGTANAQLHPLFNPQETIGLTGYEPLPEGTPVSLGTLSLTRAYIPDQIDLSPLMPPPVQQVAGSCVAFSVGYAARGYYRRLREGSVDASLPSPAHLHARIRNRKPGVPCKAQGSHPIAGVKALLSGAVDRETVPDARICRDAEQHPGPLEPRFAVNDGRIIHLKSRHGPATTRHLDIMKQELAAGHPVVFGMEIYFTPPSEPEERKGYTLALLEDDGIYQGSLAPHGAPGGGHAMVAVGYDERRRAFLVQNSWGPYWAGNGRGWISYDAILADMGTAVTMRVDFTPPRPVPGLAADMRTRLSADKLGVSSCSDIAVSAEVAGRRIATGFVEKPSDLQSLRKLGIVDASRVAVRPWPVCEAMKTLSAPRRSPIAPEIRMLAGETDLAFGDSLAFEVTMPDVPAFLYLVYIDAKGTAVNLLPRRGPLRAQQAPGARLVFGDGGPGRLTFTASPPTGNEAVIAIAARSPLMALEELETGEMLFRMPALAGVVNPGAGIETAQSSLVLTPITRSVTADDRYYLSVLRRALAERPDESALPREVGADVVHLRVGAL